MPDPVTKPANPPEEKAGEIKTQPPTPTTQKQPVPLTSQPSTTIPPKTSTPIAQTKPAVNEPTQVVPEGHPAQGIPDPTPHLTKEKVTNFKVGDKVVFEGVITDIHADRGLVFVKHLDGHGSALELVARDLKPKP